MVFVRKELSAMLQEIGLDPNAEPTFEDRFDLAKRELDGYDYQVFMSRFDSKRDIQLVLLVIEGALSFACLQEMRGIMDMTEEI